MTGSVTGGPRLLLRLEGAAIFIIALAAFWRQGGALHVGGWPLAVLLFFAPDLSMLAYLAGPRIGALAYNLAHSFLGPALLFAIGASAWIESMSWRPHMGLFPWVMFGLFFAVLWIAHIGFDRMLGYGLKYGTAFGDTHLGRIGRRAAAGQDEGRRP